jgi:hypothetical protein
VFRGPRRAKLTPRRPYDGRLGLAESDRRMVRRCEGREGVAHNPGPGTSPGDPSARGITMPARWGRRQTAGHGPERGRLQPSFNHPSEPGRRPQEATGVTGDMEPSIRRMPSCLTLTPPQSLCQQQASPTQETDQRQGPRQAEGAMYRRRQLRTPPLPTFSTAEDPD